MVHKAQSVANFNVSKTSPKKKAKNLLAYLFPRQHIKNRSTISDQGVYFKQESRIFGVPLEDAVQSGSYLWSVKVPDPVALCLIEISKRGLNTEGIFRLSGSTSEVLSLENLINTSTPEERKTIDTSKYDIHTLTSLVKKYLRDLPDPVIPIKLHSKFQSIAVIEQESLLTKELSDLILTLPMYHRNLLHTILLMASKIQQHVKTNKMGPEALATVFAPVCTGFEQSLKEQMNDPHFLINMKSNRNYCNTFQKSTLLIEQHIQKNKNWTNLWKTMIEQHEEILFLLEKYPVHQNDFAHDLRAFTNASPHIFHPYSMSTCPSPSGNRSLPSPFSINSSFGPAPTDIIMAQFHPMNSPSHTNLNQPAIIPIAQPETEFQINEQFQLMSNNNEPNSKSQNKLIKKTSFFQESNAVRKILSAGALR